MSCKNHAFCLLELLFVGFLAFYFAFCYNDHKNLHLKGHLLNFFLVLQCTSPQFSCWCNSSSAKKWWQVGWWRLENKHMKMSKGTNVRRFPATDQYCRYIPHHASEKHLSTNKTDFFLRHKPSKAYSCQKYLKLFLKCLHTLFWSHIKPVGFFVYNREGSDHHIFLTTLSPINIQPNTNTRAFSRWITTEDTFFPLMHSEIFLLHCHEMLADYSALILIIINLDLVLRSNWMCVFLSWSQKTIICDKL